MKRILALVAAAILCFSLLSCTDKPPVTTGDDTSDTVNIMPDPVDTPAVTTAPVTTDEPVTDPPAVSDPPATSEAAPQDTTSPIGDKTHVPGLELGSGFVISNSGTKLNILLNWKAVNGEKEGTADITVSVFLECYSIFVGERNDGEIRVGEKMINYSSPQLELPGSDFNEIDFGSYTFTVDKSSGASTEVPLYASWHFRGTYAGLSVDWVTVNSSIVFDN
ncbi:MAG: hypothetical protein IJN63_08595 [Clostridia bacterium]|nr:hypothetical protein [Clostridia bacterium]